jgi:hypothetical protein
MEILKITLLLMYADANISLCLDSISYLIFHQDAKAVVLKMNCQMKSAHERKDPKCENVGENEQEVSVIAFFQ